MICRRRPGTYRFLDKDGQILYVGKADRLRERVRSHFVENADNTRKVRQALRLVEHIDWDETCTPLEAVVREQQLILEHRPTCNLYGTRPETYAYIKASAAGPGLSLSTSSRAPKWLTERRPAEPPHSRRPVVIGPFRGRTRLNAALDLLQRCYPIRRCPRHPDGRPCVRADHGRCLAPCAGDPQVRMEHDGLVMDIIGWLTGRADVDLPEPLERADEVDPDAVAAATLRGGPEPPRGLRPSSSMSAGRTRRWPRRVGSVSPPCGRSAGNGDGPSVRLNLVWDGRLREPVSLRPDTLDEGIEAALDPSGTRAPRTLPTPPRHWSRCRRDELDSLLAIRRWFYETDQAPKVRSLGRMPTRPAERPVQSSAHSRGPEDSYRLRHPRRGRRVQLSRPPPPASWEAGYPWPSSPP